MSFFERINMAHYYLSEFIIHLSQLRLQLLILNNCIKRESGVSPEQYPLL